jgi:hypothetical protein
MLLVDEKGKAGVTDVNASSAIFRIHRSSRFFSAKLHASSLKIPVMMEVLGENCISP